ncbi:MAG: molybdopterin-dependent oxidoreductase [Chloroflexi bacterium]|nr:molybdopterin-dependent oxidoreductase [Chloroflexota bacterium]MBV9895144.1 molybdopterin-dependent oxidoreductase [Chloroflexota bacterium]
MPVTTPLRRNARSRGRFSRDSQVGFGGVAAALVFGLGMLLLRSTVGVRSIPERLMEWLLLFVPPGLFEAILQRFGFDAKRYGLDAAVLLALAALAWIGYEALWRGWSLPALGALGPALWLVVMLVIMPLTSAGVFASALVEGATANILGYLAISLSYAAVLMGVRVWLDRDGYRAIPLSDRRTLIVTLGGTVAAYVAAYASGLLSPTANRAPSILLVDPQEPVPSGGLDAPNPHPQAVSSPVAAAAAAPTTSPEATTTSPSLPVPIAPRELQRDKDGAVLPSGRESGQLTSAITSNQDFYIVTKNAGGDPLLKPDDWRLLVDGEVQRTFQLDYSTLRRLPSVQVTKTLECISNFVGKPELAPFGAELISTAQWKGVVVRDILGLTGGPKPDATWLAVLSADEYTSAIPMEVAMDPTTLLVYEMNGAVLPYEHGYPARLLVPGRYGMKSAKWVIGMRPMSREFLDWYAQRNWSKDAIVRTMSRIDSPAPGRSVTSGQSTLSGVAYAGSRGIKRVEFSSDGGQTWRDADFVEPAAGQDTWIRWRGTFTYSTGTPVTLAARATDGGGDVQDEAFSLPEPNGGTGWPHVSIGG